MTPKPPPREVTVERRHIDRLLWLTTAALRPDGHEDECNCAKCWQANNASSALVQELDPLLPGILSAARELMTIKAQLAYLAEAGCVGGLPPDLNAIDSAAIALGWQEGSK